MLWRLVGKLLFKACVPLLGIAGVLTYGVYLRGGDPAALWKSVAERGLGQFDKLFAGVQDDTSRAVDAISRSATSMTGNQEPSGRTEVFTWKDDEGVTHYSTARPDGVAVGTLSVDPNVNVLAPVRAPVAPASREMPGSEGSAEGLAGESSGRLPGVAGQVLATRDPGAASRDAIDPSSGFQGMDPAQLLRMLQEAE